MEGDLAYLYGQTRQMRGTMLEFLTALPPEALTVTFPEYGQGSVLSTLTHVADGYGGWVGRTLVEEEGVFAEQPDDLPALTQRFGRVDALLERSLVCPRMRSGKASTCVGMAGNTRQVTARWLVLHPLTHECFTIGARW